MVEEDIKELQKNKAFYCHTMDVTPVAHPDHMYLMTEGMDGQESVTGIQDPKQEGKPSHEPQCQESQKRNDLECSNSDSDEGDLEELTGKSLETIGVTLVIPQHPSQTDSKHDANLLYELFKKASSELAGDGSNTCRYCRQPVWCTLEHMQRRHFRYAIRFESKGIKKITIPCYCEGGSREKYRCHWHCPECRRVLTRAENFKSHIVLHGYEVPGYEGKVKTSREPQLKNKREVCIPWNEIRAADPGSDEEDLENLSEQSAELMIMTGEIQDHVYHINKDTAEGAKVHNEAITEDIQKLCRGTENCKYCGYHVLCTPEHMQYQHLRNAIHFTSKGVKKFTISCFCESGGLKISSEHWHCPECCRVVTCAENFKTHIASHGFKVTDLKHKVNTPHQPPLKSERDVFISPSQIRDAEDPNPTSDEEDLREQSAELMTITGEIQDHVYHTNQDIQGATEDKSDSAEVLDEFFTEDIEKLSRGNENCKYCRHPVLCTQQHMQHRHLRNAIRFECNGVIKFSIPCFCEIGAREKHRCHWHCPKCRRIVTRAENFKKHLSTTHGLRFTQMRSKGRNQMVRCLGPEWNEEDLEKLIGQSADTRDMTLENYQKYLSQITEYPFGEKRDSTEQPELPMTESKEHGRSTKHCRYCKNTVLCTPKHMRTRHVKFAIHFESDGVKKFTIPCYCDFEVRVLYRSHWHCPKCWLILTRTENFKRHLGLHGCKFIEQKRPMKGFKVIEKKHSKKNNSTHDPERPRDEERQWNDLEDPEPMSDEKDIGEAVEQHTETMEFTPEIGCKHVGKMTEYVWREKRIPFKLPQELSTRERKVPEGFEPAESTCPYCPGPSPPALGSRKLVTCHGTVYGLSAVTKDVSVYIKKCVVCRHPVRFQDYQSGFHNYNNRTFLTIPLCSMMTAGLGNHIAIGRFLEIMESHLSVSLPMNEIGRAFHHFSALRDYEYSYSCVRCGNSPPVLIADTNCKDVFDLPADLFNRPNKVKINSEDTEVNVRDRWETFEKRMVASGLCDGTKIPNPYTSGLSYSSFTPWLGQNVRVSDTVPKTEALKGLSQKGQAPDLDPVSAIDEDAILKVLESDSPKRRDLVKACTALGAPLSGATADLIHRLRELLLYKDLYPKMFVKLKKTGGAVLCLTCPHSVVYYHSPLWWQESARDHGDALLSFRQPPTVYISDIAGRVARHVNDRTSQRFFQPYDGRLCADTEENAMAATEKWLQVRFPWVTSDGLVLVQTASANEFPPSDQFSELHPVTGTNARFSLYPRLPQRNPKRSEDLLRSVKLAPDLAAAVSPLVSQPLSRELSTSRHYFSQTEEEDQYLFSIRLYFHLHNLSVNEKYRKSVQLQTPRHVTAVGVNVEENRAAHENSEQTVSNSPLKRKRDDS